MSITGHNQVFDEEGQSQFVVTLNHQQQFPEKVEVKDSSRTGIDPANNRPHRRELIQY